MKKTKKKNIGRYLEAEDMSSAPKNKALISQSESQLLQLQIELSGLSALFKNMGDCEFTSDELHGIGLSLEGIAVRVLASLSGLSGAPTHDSDLRI